MIYISGANYYMCSYYMRLLGLSPNEWKYVREVIQLQGAREQLFIQLPGMWEQSNYDELIYNIKSRKFKHVIIDF